MDKFEKRDAERCLQDKFNTLQESPLSYAFFKDFIRTKMHQPHFTRTALLLIDKLPPEQRFDAACYMLKRSTTSRNSLAAARKALEAVDLAQPADGRFALAMRIVTNRLYFHPLQLAKPAFTKALSQIIYLPTPEQRAKACNRLAASTTSRHLRQSVFQIKESVLRGDVLTINDFTVLAKQAKQQIQLRLPII